MTSAATGRGRLKPRLLALFVALPILVALPVWAFTWASASPEPHGLPVGVVGSPGAVQAIEDQVAEHDGAFDLRTYDSAATATDAIENRDVYGAIVTEGPDRKLFTASAASPAVAEVLTTTFAPPSEGPAPVVDVVPADADDPRGSALGSLVLPLVLVSVITAVIVLLIARPGWEQIAMIAVAAVVGAGVAVAIAQGGFGILGGDWTTNSVAPALTIAAISGTIVGLVSAFGRFGFVAVAPLMLFLGNPWSGATSSPYLLPEPAGVIGQLLPPGAGATALRNLAFFDGAGASTPLLVLSAWIAVGVAGICVGVLRRSDPGRELTDATRPVMDAMQG
ncbi:ABC transporter permease [Solicola gregarius]|uniref:ABC transporter permease n=1 Tax=Solicola gregarius TaxID=2908642 RepID=A0AA46TKI5_9ACTN|nr:ABC transporter permease [Solicola gregarius]UYM06113.1 ABC transporter permease [Solicola gregarius]